MASNEVLPFPCVSAETLEWCALIGLHLLAADYEVGSSGSQSLDLGDLWRYSYPKKAVTGTATLSHGLRAKALHLLNSANTTCQRYRANALLPGRWCCVKNTACLRALTMFSTKD